MKKLYLLLLLSFVTIDHQLKAEVLKTPPRISSENLQIAVEELHQELMADLQANKDDCELLRQKMDELMAHLNYNPLFIVGKDGRFYKEGMHKEFTKEPKPMKTKIDRNPLTVQLELTHVDLYHCDKRLYNQIARLADFTANGSAEKMEPLLVTINERLQQLPRREQRRLKRKKRQRAWLQSELIRLLIEASTIDRPGLLSKPLEQLIEQEEEVAEEVDNQSPTDVTISEETKSNYAFLLFPNPNDGHFQLQMNAEWSNQTMLSIMDIHGREILSKKVDVVIEKQIMVDLPNAVPGAYFARLKDEQKEWQKLFVIE